MFAESTMCPIATHEFINFVAVICGVILLYIGYQARGIKFWHRMFILIFGIGLMLIDGYYLGTWIFGG